MGLVLMTSNDSKSGTPTGCRYDRALPALRIEDVTITDPVVLAEVRHWASGARGPLADDDALETADLTPYVSAALRTFSSVVPFVSDERQVTPIQQAIAGLGRQAAEAVAAAAESTRQVSERSEKELTRATESVAKGVQDTLRHMREGAHESVTAMTNELTKLVAGDDSAAARHVQAAVAAAGEKFATTLEQRLERGMTEIENKFDLRIPTSPIGQLAGAVRSELEKCTAAAATGHRQVSERVDKLTSVVAEATAAAKATARTTVVTPLKGKPFEVGVHGVLDSLAAEVGDEYLPSGESVGLLARCKKGDGVWTIGEVPGTPGITAKVVVEMHNGDASTRNWPAYLEEAERNRGASVSLGIVRTVDQVPGGSGIRVWGSRRIVLAYDPQTDDPGLLRVVVLLLRAQACLAAGRRGTDQVHAAEEELAAALVQVAALTDLQRTAAATRAGAEKLATGLGLVHDKVTRSIEAALSALRDVTAQSDAA